MAKNINFLIEKSDLSEDNNALKISKTLLGLKQSNINFNIFFVLKKRKWHEIDEKEFSDLTFIKSLIQNGKNINPDSKRVFIEAGSGISFKTHKSFQKGIGMEIHCGKDYNYKPIKFRDYIRIHDPFFQNDLPFDEKTIKEISLLVSSIWGPIEVEIS